jgi:hypothetical protein
LGFSKKEPIRKAHCHGFLWSEQQYHRARAIVMCLKNSLPNFKVQFIQKSPLNLATINDELKNAIISLEEYYWHFKNGRPRDDTKMLSEKSTSQFFIA